jgi:hypothetical protein
MAGKSRSMLRFRALLSRTLPVFLVCLLISALFWVLLAFNGYYNTAIRVPVTYINMPVDSFLQEKLPTEIELEIGGNGYQLLTYMIRPEKAAIQLNGHLIGMSANQNKGDAFIALSIGIDYFNRVHNDVKAIRSNPDTIYFNFFKQGFRKIPVKLKASINFEPGNGLAEEISIQPDSIHISGPAEILNQVNFLETEMLNLSGIRQSGNYPVKIKQPYKDLDYAPVEVNITIPVEKYTEAVFDIPLKINNLNNRDSVEIYPSLIKISCSVALSRYSSLKPDSFLIVADIKTLRGKKLKVTTEKIPLWVNNVRLVPDYVDCIVRQKR